MAIARITPHFLAQLQAHLDRISSIGDAAVRDAHLGTLRKVVDVLEAHAAEEATIATDLNLSEQGQIARTVALVKKTLPKLQFIAELATEADTAYNRGEALVYAVPPQPDKSTNEIVQFLREDSIRRRLETLSPAERIAKLQVAVQQGQIETVRAFRLVPGEPMIPTDVQERIVREQAAATDPKGARRLQSLDIVRTQLHELSTTLVNWLRGYGAKVDFPAPNVTPAQWLIGYGDEVTFPVPQGRPAGSVR